MIIFGFYGAIRAEGDYIWKLVHCAHCALGSRECSLLTLDTNYLVDTFSFNFDNIDNLFI